MINHTRKHLVIVEPLNFPLISDIIFYKEEYSRVQTGFKRGLGTFLIKNYFLIHAKVKTMTKYYENYKCEYSSSEECHKTYKVKRGKRGYPGFTGPQGATGATGPTGGTYNTFLEVQSTTGQDIDSIIVGQPVRFDQVVLEEGIGFNGNAAVIQSDGAYFFHYNLQFYNSGNNNGTVFVWNVLDGDNGGLRSILSVPALSYAPLSYGQEYFLLEGTTYEVYWTSTSSSISLYASGNNVALNNSNVPSAVLDIIRIG